jgi:hypothetical protein
LNAKVQHNLAVAEFTHNHAPILANVAEDIRKVKSAFLGGMDSMGMKNADSMQMDADPLSHNELR